MKLITDHHDGLGLNDAIRIEASDEDANGVPHRIEFFIGGLKNPLVGFLQFQKGPRNVEGSTPGLLTDAVLVSLIEILKGFQDGPFKSREGALVLTKLEEAFHWTQARAKNRAKRGVLGHSKI